MPHTTTILCAFSAVTALGVGPTAHAQLALEVNEDGHQSVLVRPTPTDGQGWVTRGVSVPFPTTPDMTLVLRRQVGGLKVADMNGDGKNDIVVGCYSSNSFPPYDDWHDFILYNDYQHEHSDLGAWPMWISSNQTHTGDILVGEIDGNPGLEVVTIHGSLNPQSVRIYRGAPGGPETTASFVSSTPQNVWGTSGLLVDLDNDGDLDLVTANQGIAPDSFRPMYQFENEGGVMNPVPVWQSAEQSIQGGLSAGDVDGDGDLDIGVSKWVNFTSGIYYNLGGTLDVNQGAFTGDTGGDRGTALVDFNGDGELELAVGSDPARLFDYGEGLLTPYWMCDLPFDSEPQDLVAYDVDGDGDTDLAQIIFADGRAHIHLNRDGVLDVLPSWTFDASEVGTAIAFGDIDGDGLDDLVTGYSGDTCVRVFLANPPSCSPADLADPFGQFDFSDVVAFLTAFTSMQPEADLAEPFGQWDFTDVIIFLALFNTGCQ
ncbi:MAG: VCBS repeat-containing protein [Phycisphaerales bacterium]